MDYRIGLLPSIIGSCLNVNVYNFSFHRNVVSYRYEADSTSSGRLSQSRDPTVGLENEGVDLTLQCILKLTHKGQYRAGGGV